MAQALDSQQIVEGERGHRVDGVGEVGMNDDAIHVAHDQQRRVLQIQSVLQQLTVRLVEIGVFAFILPAKVTTLENIGKPMAAVLLGRTVLKRKAFAGRIVFRRGRVIDKVARSRKCS